MPTTQVCCLAETSSSGYESWIRLARALADSWLLPAGELGIYYQDLYHLVKPLHKVICLLLALYIPSICCLPWTQHQNHPYPHSIVNGPRHAHGRSEHDPLIPPITAYGSITHLVSNSSTHSILPTLLPASHAHKPSLLDQVSTDLIPFAEYLCRIFSFYRSSDVSDMQSVCKVLLRIHSFEGRSHAYFTLMIGGRYRWSGRHPEMLGHWSPGASPKSLQTYHKRQRECPCRDFASTE